MDLPARARAWRADLRRALVLEAAARAAGGTLAAAGALALLDRSAALPRPSRLAAFALWGAWLAWMLARDLWLPWRRLGWDEVLSTAARRWPETRDFLASAWGLRARPAGPGVSEELRAEHLARADLLAASLPGEPLARWEPRPPARRLAAASAVLLLVNAVAGDRASWLRVLAPWRDASLERWVAIEPGDARLDWGSPATVSARPRAAGAARGLSASSLVLEIRGEDGAWRKAAWSRAGADESVWSVDALSVPLAYRVRWRDLLSAARRLEPVLPPRWRRAETVVRGARSERRFDLGAQAVARARRGDWVSVEGEADGPLSYAELRPSGRPPLPLRLEGGIWKTGFPAAEDFTFSFGLVSGDGRRDPSPPSYALSVAADAPPTVELLSPQVPLVASPEDSIPVAYAARDDGAVMRLALVARSAGRPERATSLPAPQPPRGEVLGDWSWGLEGLSAGARVEFWLEATDDAVPPQTARSEKGSIAVVDASADHAAALEARAEAEADLEKAAVRAEAARDASARGDLPASRAQTAALKGEWSAAAKSLAAWSRRSGSDPRGDPGLSEEAARASEEFARAGEDGLPGAEKALAEGDAAKARREQAALAEQARGVQRALREGAGAQSLQDMADGAARAQRASDSLAREAERLASRGREGTVAAGELEALERALAKIEEALEALRRAVKALPEAEDDAPPSQARRFPFDEAREAAADLRRALASGDVAAAAQAARRLAERLSGLSKTLEESGRRSADSRVSRGREAAGRVRRSWQEAVEAQTQAVEAARALDDMREKRRLAAQKDLLAELAGDQETVLSSAAARPGLWPESSRSAAAEALRRFRAGAAGDAGARLDAAARLLRLHALSRPGESEALSAFAASQESLSARLAAGAGAPGPDPALAREAADAQARARERAVGLRSEVGRASRERGFLSGRLARQVDEVLSEQERGERALRRGDAPEGLRRAEEALSLLQQGDAEAGAASSAAQSAAGASGGEGGSGRFMRGAVRAAPRAATGAGMGRVRIPSVDEYRPPRELREELERSLREPRPAAHDPEIKEYFKRLAR